MIKRIIETYKSTHRVKQAVGLFLANIIGIPLGIITSLLLTRYLGSQGFGNYKFILSIFNLVVIICNFGLFHATSQALVLNTDKLKAKEYYGALLVFLGGIFMVISVLLILYTLFDANVQEKDLANLFLYLIPFSWVFLLLRYFESLFQADNQIRMLAKIRIYPQFFFLIGIFFLAYVYKGKQLQRLEVILLIYIATQVFVYLFTLFSIHISFKNLKIRLIEIWRHCKSFGFNMYLGIIFSLGFSGLTEVLISYFGIDNRGVGLYSLALTFAMPLAYIPNTIATTHFRDFASKAEIPPKLLFITLSLSIASLFGLWIVIGPIVNILYGREFISVIRLNFIIGIGVVAHGFGDFINSFLSTKGEGKTLRNVLIIYGVFILIFNLILIPKFGAFGAAFAKLITSFIYLILIFKIYITVKGENVHNLNK
jgi:O-antigen/teichoic acid export membrane protein